MKLRTKISILTATLSAIPVFILGGVAVVTVQRSFSTLVDNSLIETINQPRLLRDLRNNQLEPIRGLADSFISIARYEADGTFTVLRSTGGVEENDDFPILSSQEIFNASREIITIRNKEGFRVVAFEGREKEVYVVAASLRGNQTAIWEVLKRTGLAALFISLISGFLAWLVVNRFFQPVNKMVEVAHAVADGDFSQSMPKVPAGTEFGDLSIAINKMMFALRQFVSDASHELRTPLTVIRGYSEILQKPNIDIEQRDRAATRIETESLRMEKLVKDLLTLTKADSVNNNQLESVDLLPIMTEYFKDLSNQEPKREIKFTGLSSAILNCNENAIRQLFSNLTQNILRHTPRDSKVLVNIAKDDLNIEITIDDSGPGIPIGDRNKVFERFSRLDESRSRDTGGFGLGMSIIKSVVDRHYGQIFLEDSIYKGLRVRLIFPI